MSPLKKTCDDPILLKEDDNPRHFGVAEDAKNGTIVQPIEKAENPPSNLALVGVHIFTSHIHGAIDRIAPLKRGEREITDTIQKLIPISHHVKSFVLKDWRLDTGKKNDLLTANAIMLDEWGKKIFRGPLTRQPAYSAGCRSARSLRSKQARFAAPS